MEKVIILGKDSYIGESLYKWLTKYRYDYEVQIVSTMNREWENVDFNEASVVVNFAGIAHINNIPEKMKELFYSVNRDLAIRIGEHVKSQGVKFLIHFSSMNVYGDFCDNITDLNVENPTSFYGDSKLQGDIELRKIEEDQFQIAYIRPPFVYGKGCKGNYNLISSLAKKVPVFPKYKNKKSMIYIDNLCEFVRMLIDKKSGGVYAPQNKELVSTYELVREIRKNANKKTIFTRVFNWMIPIVCRVSKLCHKAFANDYYELGLSDYFDFKYCIVDFPMSIEMTEKR